MSCIDQPIKYDFNLPNHNNELSNAEEVIEKLKDKLKKIKKDKNINDTVHETMYEEAIRVLDYVGGLSDSIFKIGDEMENFYKMEYLHSPELGKKLWLDNYDKIHHPYDLLKNRCFTLLDELDIEYRRRFRKNPPNWNP